MIYNVNSLNYKFMGSIDGEIPAVWFLISSIGFIILSFIQYRNTGKSINTIFLSIMAILFLFSYFILLFKTWFIPTIHRKMRKIIESPKKWYILKSVFVKLILNWEATDNWPIGEKPRGTIPGGRKLHKASLNMWSGRHGGSASTTCQNNCSLHP